jgi:hypothetical protein
MKQLKLLKERAIMSTRNSISDIRAVNFSRTLIHPETGEPVRVNSFEIQVKRAGESGWKAIDIIERDWSDEQAVRTAE